MIWWYVGSFFGSPPASAALMSCTLSAPKSSRSRWIRLRKISPSTAASSEARWWLNGLSFRYFATVSSLQFLMSLSIARHMATVSM